VVQVYRRYLNLVSQAGYGGMPNTLCYPSHGVIHKLAVYTTLSTVKIYANEVIILYSRSVYLIHSVIHF